MYSRSNGCTRLQGLFPPRGRTARRDASRARSQPRSWRPSARQQHPDLVAIATISLAELRDEIAFLEPDADQDVAGGRGRKQQMPERHHRRRPEAEQEPEIDRMAHVAIEEWRP